MRCTSEQVVLSVVVCDGCIRFSQRPGSHFSESVFILILMLLIFFSICVFVHVCVLMGIEARRGHWIPGARVIGSHEPLGVGFRNQAVVSL